MWHESERFSGVTIRKHLENIFENINARNDTLFESIWLMMMITQDVVHSFQILLIFPPMTLYYWTLRPVNLCHYKIRGSKSNLPPSYSYLPSPSVHLSAIKPLLLEKESSLSLLLLPIPSKSGYFLKINFVPGYILFLIGI